MGKRIRYRRETGENQIKGPVWLTTFNDMATLLLVFFVLLFTMGSLDVQRYKHFRNALQSAMGVLNAGRHAPVGLIAEEDYSLTRALNKERESVPVSDRTIDQAVNQASGERAMEDLQLTRGLEAEYTPRGIQLTLNDNVLFSSGEASLTERGKKMLSKVAAIIKPLDRSIRVEGHSDNVPIRTRRFPSNWELSTARAVHVVKFFIEQGGIDPRRLSASGCADTKPRTANDSASSRARNRRVEIILEKIFLPSSNQNQGPPETMQLQPSGDHGGI